MLIHAAFSTKNREPWMTPRHRERIFPYLGGIAKEHKIKPLKIGGVADRVHLLLSLPPTLSISKALQLLKGGSSKWIHDIFHELKGFAWVAGLPHGELYRTNRNIIAPMTFQEEFLSFLKKHEAEYDERYVWG